ncbi:MAG: histidine phosphatase family protein [Halarcobacter sp.]
MKYLIRHAEKTNSSVHAKLSDQGLIDSKNYGKELWKSNTNIELIVTSPIERCVQTAENIVLGINKDIPVIEAIELGNPGVYIRDDKKAMTIFEKFSLLEIFNLQLSKSELDGFNSIDLASQRLVDFINSHNKNTIFISHDAIIVPFINWLQKKQAINDFDMIDYLFEYKISDFI